MWAIPHDNAVAAYNKIAKRVAELKDEGDIDETDRNR